MSDAEQLLARYLRQVAELGGNEIYLDTMSPAEALAGLRARIAGSEPGAAMNAAAAAPMSGASGIDAFRQALEPAQHSAARTAPPRQAGAIPYERDTSAPRDATALPMLAERAAVCTLCRLWEGRTHSVFGEGSINADLVVVGEAPGEEEDRTGRPFVGRAGKLLDLLLLTAGFPRDQVYICNVVKCRPPGNRNPEMDEAETCSSNYLFAQLDAIAPRAILAVGKFAAQALLKSEQSISRLRGTTHTYRNTPLIVTYHPAYLLRSPQMTRVAWEDYQLVRKVLDGKV